MAAGGEQRAFSPSGRRLAPLDTRLFGQIGEQYSQRDRYEQELQVLAQRFFKKVRERELLPMVGALMAFEKGGDAYGTNTIVGNVADRRAGFQRLNGLLGVQAAGPARPSAGGRRLGGLFNHGRRDYEAKPAQETVSLSLVRALA